VRLGASWPDRLRLAGATLEFHASNFARPGRPSAAPTPDRYRVQLGGRVTDLWLRRRSGDFFVLHEVFTSAVYQFPRKWLGDPATVVDLGANVGLTTLFFAQFFPEARYICVEPNPANAAILRRNVAWLGARAQVIEAAVSDRSGQVSFDDTLPSYDGHIASGIGLQAFPLVRACTLDEIVASCGLARIDLLKIDIEGAERDVFARSPDCLSQVGVIIIELHRGYALADFEKDVAPLGFTVIPPGSAHGNAMLMMLMAVAPQHLETAATRQQSAPLCIVS
jgi:FkbM family methyltransferase